MPRKPKSPLGGYLLKLLEQFGDGPMTAQANDIPTTALMKALIDQTFGGARWKHHLSYPAGAAKPAAVTNQRNGNGVLISISRVMVL